MEKNIPDRVLRELTFFAGKHGIHRIILFGSRARGTHTERSDIDLAVTGGDFDAFYWDVQEKLHSLLKVDIVEMNRPISSELAEEIRRDGVVIYEEA